MRILNIPYRGKKKQFWNLWYWAKRNMTGDVALVSHRAEKNSSHAHKTGFWYFSGFFQNFWQVPHTFDVGVPQGLKAKMFLRKIWFWTVISSLMKSGGGLFKLKKKPLCVLWVFESNIYGIDWHHSSSMVHVYSNNKLSLSSAARLSGDK